MKILLTLTLLLTASQLSAQTDFSTIDSRVREGKWTTSDVASLTRELTTDYDTELEKVRAIFIWITDNVKYDCKKFKAGGGGRTSIRASSPEELARMKAQFKAEKISNTLKKKRGICQDYSDLFVKMCQLAGIESKVIGGYGRKSLSDLGRPPGRASHAWNSVKIDEKWYLTDLTWASGYTDPKATKFIKRFNDGLFLVEPEIFILNHYPIEASDQHLAVPVSKKGYENLPLPKTGFFSEKVTDYSPKISTIDRAQNKKFTFHFAQMKDKGQLFAFDNFKKKVDLSVKKGEDFLEAQLNEVSRGARYLTFALRKDDGTMVQLLTYRLGR